MKNFKRHGETIDFVAAADTPSGKLVMVGGIAAVALNNTANGATGEARAEGVYEMPVATGLVIVQGTDAYVTSGGVITNVSTSNTRIGRFWSAKAAGPVLVDVKINVP